MYISRLPPLQWLTVPVTRIRRPGSMPAMASRPIQRSRTVPEPSNSSASTLQQVADGSTATERSVPHRVARQRSGSEVTGVPPWRPESSAWRRRATSSSLRTREVSALRQLPSSMPSRLRPLGGAGPVLPVHPPRARRRSAGASGPRPAEASGPGRRGRTPGLTRRAVSGTRSGSGSRGAIGSVPRTTTTWRTRLSRSSPRAREASSSGRAAPMDCSTSGPENTARTNQRGPSTPQKRCTCSTLRPSGSVVGTLATSSVPKLPWRSSVDPPPPPTAAAISGRTSSQTPLLRGAANAVSCTEEASACTVTAATAPLVLSTSSRIFRSLRAGSRRAPRSR